MAVPPPQQKLLDFSPSIVTIGAFQAVNNSVGKIGGVWNEPAHRGGGTVADIVKRSDHAAQPGFSGRPSESTKTSASTSLGNCITA